jgi:hypothetical protein
MEEHMQTDSAKRITASDVTHMPKIRTCPYEKWTIAESVVLPVS